MGSVISRKGNFTDYTYNSNQVNSITFNDIHTANTQKEIKPNQNNTKQQFLNNT